MSQWCQDTSSDLLLKKLVTHYKKNTVSSILKVDLPAELGIYCTLALYGSIGQILRKQRAHNTAKDR